MPYLRDWQAEEEEPAKKRLSVSKMVEGVSGEGVDLVVKEIESVKKGVINSNQNSYAVGHLRKMEIFYKD